MVVKYPPAISKEVLHPSYIFLYNNYVIIYREKGLFDTIFPIEGHIWNVYPCSDEHKALYKFSRTYKRKMYRWIFLANSWRVFLFLSFLILYYHPAIPIYITIHFVELFFHLYNYLT